MTTLEILKGWFRSRKTVLVALSGGVDSALVALAAHMQLGDGAVAVTADYSTLSRDERDSAGRVCAEIGIRHVMIKYDELENEDFARNDSRRCYYCRSELGERLAVVAAIERSGVIVDGTNVSDLGEYRAGVAAMRERGVRSPLVETGFTKEDVRREAREAGLSVHDRPSNACLASRIPWGRRVTAERLARIETAETAVRNATGVRQVRVRDIGGGAARIEVEAEGVKRAVARADEIVTLLRAIGFRSISIDPEGYGPGKANDISR